MNLMTIRQSANDVDAYGQQEPAAAPEGVSIVRWVLTFLLRRWLLIGSVAAVVASASFIAAMLETPKYAATAIVLVSPGEERVLPQEQMVATGNTMPAASALDSHIQVLTSPMLMGRLVDSLGLVSNPDYNGGVVLPETPPAPGTAEAGQYAAVRQGLINAIGNAVSVRRRAASYALEVRAETESPQLSADVANRLVDLYLDYQFEARFQTTERANDWLTARVAELREELQEKEAAAERFRAESGLLSTQGVLYTEQQTTEIQASVLSARADLAQREAQYRQLQQMIDAGSPDTIASVLNSDVIASLRSREADVARRQADLEARYGELHPSIQNIRAERAGIADQISAEVQRISASMLNDVEIARARLETMQASLGDVRGQLAGNSGALVELRELEREAAAARTVYESFLERFHTLSDQGNLRSAGMQLVSAATPPTTKSSPQLRIALLLSLVLGLALGLSAGILAEALEEGFRTAEEIERALNVPVLSSVPRLRPKEMRALPLDQQHPAGYLVERQMSAFTEAFRVARTAIVYGSAHRKNQVLAVTSALPNEGKTTVSLCLARASALSQQRVLIIDCDLRRRSLKEVLGFEPEVGLLQVLAGETPWRDAIVIDEASGMHVLPLKEARFIADDVFGSSAMSALLTELRAHFDLIVLDCAPVLAVAETRVLASLADAALVVTRWEKTPTRAVKQTMQQLTSTRDNVLGVVLNNVDTRVPGYAYHMGSYYQS